MRSSRSRIYAAQVHMWIIELRPLGTSATWQAERAVGAHDLNTLRLRPDTQGDTSGLEPGGLAIALDSSQIV
jgi:hypothetical protein